MRSVCASTGCLRRPIAYAPPSSRPAGKENVPEDDAIRCDACPVLCYIKPGRTGACDRYANDNGQLVRIDPHVVLNRALSRGDSVVPFLERDREWDGSIVTSPETFVTAIGAGTTYPDYKPAPFIFSSAVRADGMLRSVNDSFCS